MEFDSATYREALLQLSQNEKAMIDAVQRRDRSLAHEMHLNTYRALALQTSLENVELLLPFRKWEAEAAMIVNLLRTMPLRLSQHIYKIRRAMQELIISIPCDIGDLKTLRELRWNVVHGSSNVRTPLLLHEIFSSEEVKRRFRVEQGRILRSQVKDHHGGCVSVAHRNKYKDIEIRLEMLRTRKPMEEQVMSILEGDRKQYVKFGLLTAILITLGRQRKVRKLLYHVTTFPLHRASSATPTKSEEFRGKWFAIFRTTLDAWNYETPNVRRASLPLHALLLDWTAIMDYKISQRPDLVTDRHIENGKRLNLATRDLMEKSRKESQIIQQKRLDHRNKRLVLQCAV
ncbi:hypothetical protein HBI56_129410 [Parastagonospora nodorum]|nr:hypothetical protein HBI56_129410 [Parastagonospora nodorum]